MKKEFIPFFDRLKRGLCKSQNIDDDIHKWHQKKGMGKSLHEYLGMTWDLYKEWLDDPSCLERYYNTVKVASRNEE